MKLKGHNRSDATSECRVPQYEYVIYDRRKGDRGGGRCGAGSWVRNEYSRTCYTYFVGVAF